MTISNPTLLEVQTRILNESALGAGEGDLTGWINEGYLDACRRTHCYQDFLPTITFTATTADYVLGTAPFAAVTDLTEVIQLFYTSPNYGPNPQPLRRVGPVELMRERQMSPVGVPPRVFTLLGDNNTPKISLWPNPSVGDTMSGIYAKRPALVAAAGDTFPGLPPEFVFRLLEPYGLWKSARLDARLLDAPNYKQEYEQQLSMLGRDAQKLAGSPTAGFRPRYVARRPYRRDLDRG